MENFTIHNPVKILFGKGKIAAIAGEIPRAARVLMTYGGGSIMKNGVYEQVRAAIDGRDVAEFGGIEPNPVYETLLRAVEQGAPRTATSCSPWAAAACSTVRSSSRRQ